MDNDRKREIECKIYSLENEVKDLKSELDKVINIAINYLELDF